jgi:hypothetical protein
MTLPNVHVIVSKYLAGVSAPEDLVSATSLLTNPFADTFQHYYDTDAHLVTYALADGTEIPRINKPMLPHLRTNGQELLTMMLVLDYDTPQHSRWTETAQAQWLDALQAIDFPLAMQWSLLYTTRNGARLVYVLDNPIPVDQSEKKHQWLCQEFCKHGIQIDKACSDWTRVFRLPYVVRDKLPTWEDKPSVIYIEQLDNRLRVADLGEADPLRGKVVQYASIADFTNPQPTPEDAQDLLEATNNITGRTVQTAWYQTAKRRLKGRDCYPCAFEHQPIAKIGDRDNTILKYVGSATSLLYNSAGTTPEHIYALFLDPVQQLEPDKNTRDWTKMLWSAVGRMWVREAAKVQTTSLQVAQQEVDTRSLSEKVLDGMKSWCNLPALHVESKEEALEAAKRYLIVSLDAKYYLMGEDGFYEPHPLTRDQLIVRIRNTQMGSIIQTRSLTADGARYVDKDWREIFNAHGTIAYNLQATPCIKSAWVERISENDATLHEPSYRLNENLEPKFDSDVHEWLRQLFGDNFERGCDWIRWALAFDEGPICALSIAGGAGVGKKLLGMGLTECLAKPAHAETSDLTSDYQDGLLKSPFLIVNEGWPRTNSGKHPADQFRALVGGDPVMVNRKYMPRIEVRNPVRIVLTANNMEVIKMLTANRDLSPEDREALSVRLLHFDVGKQAAVWFRMKGGRRFTSKQGHRWIAGDGGGDQEKSDFVVARHFLYLYSMRTTPPGDRFLVEGGNSEEVMWEMRTGSGSSPLVIETIIHLLNQQSLATGVCIDGGRIYLLVSAVLKLYREVVSASSRERLTSGQIRSVLKGLMVSREIRIMEGRKNLGVQEWYELDLGLLASVARRDGYVCHRLDDIRMSQEIQELWEADGNAKLETVGGVAPKSNVKESIVKPNSGEAGVDTGRVVSFVRAQVPIAAARLRITGEIAGGGVVE